MALPRDRWGRGVPSELIPIGCRSGQESDLTETSIPQRRSHGKPFLHRAAPCIHPGAGGGRACHCCHGHQVCMDNLAQVHGIRHLEPWSHKAIYCIRGMLSGQSRRLEAREAAVCSRAAPFSVSGGAKREVDGDHGCNHGR